MPHDIVIDGRSLTINDVISIARSEAKISLNPSALEYLASSRLYVDRILESQNPYYGLNTGFGALAEKAITKKRDLRSLQARLIQSHAVGVDRPLSVDQARAMMLLRLNTVLAGHSGCRPLIAESLASLLNANAAPFIPSRGSVGASGDLAPLAHLVLLLQGQGPAYIGTKETLAAKVLKKTGMTPLELEAKEGLSLINGTQAMTSIACFAVFNGTRLYYLANAIAAASVDALAGSSVPFDARLHEQRPHLGQIECASMMRQMLEGSQIHKGQNSKRVQDAYSLRCIPQVHGAVKDALNHAHSTVEIEINSVTDNPLIFPGTNGNEIDVLSGGNFHGQYLAMILDYLAIALSTLGNIAERRIEQMLNPALSAGLPPFLAADPGLNSGYMIMQVMAASLVNENKVLSHPASTDSIPTSANREDFVSMGMTSANKINQIIENVYQILAVELLCACQALDFRSKKAGKYVRQLHSQTRLHVPFAKQDRPLRLDQAKAVALLKSGALLHDLPLPSSKEAFI